MSNFITNYLIKRAHKRVNRVLNKKSGQPENSDEWKVRSVVCEELLNGEKTIDKYTIIALNMIKEESAMMTELYDAKKTADYLVDFANEKGFDTFIQTSEPKFADEFRIYRNKSKITVIKNGIEIDYKTSSWNPGKHYEYKENNTEYTINLISQPIEKININIETEDNSENIMLNLKKIDTE